MGIGGGEEEKTEKDGRKAKAWDGVGGSGLAGKRTDSMGSLVGHQQPQLPGLPSVLLQLLPEDGFGEEKLSLGKGNAVVAPRTSAVGTLPRVLGSGCQRRILGRAWPQQPRGVDEDMHDMHEDSFAPPP